MVVLLAYGLHVCIGDPVLLFDFSYLAQAAEVELIQPRALVVGRVCRSHNHTAV